MAEVAKGHFIAVRNSTIRNALIADLGAEDPAGATRFAALCRLLAAIFHYEYFDELEGLREAYFPFSPEIPHSEGPASADLEATYGELMERLERMLRDANFVEIKPREMARAERAQSVVPVEVSSAIEDYRDIRFFRRGHRRGRVEVRDWFGLRRRSFEVDIHEHLLLLAALKPNVQQPVSRRRGRRPRRGARAGAVLIKYFRDIASGDLDSLLPDARIVMGTRDKMALGLPALLGGIPLLFKLAPAIAVLFFLLGIRFGFAGATDEDYLKQAVVVISGLFALGGFVMHQWMKYERQALRYQMKINENIYFRNVNNNAGIFDTLIGAAEDQQCKETFLAYWFLMRAEKPLAEAELDRRVEAWLAERFAVEVDFEADDALAKLERFGLLRRAGAALSVLGLEESLVRLERRWSAPFRREVEPA